jgi:hypothetical protein
MVSIALSSGDGAFQSPVNYRVGTNPCSIFATDLDGDTDNDLAVVNQGSDSNSILINQSIPTFIGLSPSPDKYQLSQSYPIPFTPATTIHYDLPKAVDAIIKIFDILGRKIDMPVNGIQGAGHHQIVWNGMVKHSGVYFYILRAGDFIETRKMRLLK